LATELLDFDIVEKVIKFFNGSWQEVSGRDRVLLISWMRTLKIFDKPRFSNKLISIFNFIVGLIFVGVFVVYYIHSSLFSFQIFAELLDFLEIIAVGNGFFLLISNFWTSFWFSSSGFKLEKLQLWIHGDLFDDLVFDLQMWAWEIS
jgi:hypothetical protein